jgi:hypothetical protein
VQRLPVTGSECKSLRKQIEAAATDVLADVEDNIMRIMFAVATFPCGDLPFSMGVLG